MRTVACRRVSTSDTVTAGGSGADDAFGPRRSRRGPDASPADSPHAAAQFGVPPAEVRCHPSSHTVWVSHGLAHNILCHKKLCVGVHFSAKSTRFFERKWILSLVADNIEPSTVELADRRIGSEARGRLMRGTRRRGGGKPASGVA